MKAIDILLWAICICGILVVAVIAAVVILSVIRGMILAKEDTDLYRKNRMEKENTYREKQKEKVKKALEETQ